VIYTIQNDRLRVTVSALGAELQSVRSVSNDEEFLWQGDGDIWSGRAPVLFPIVGALKDAQMQYDGQIYSLPRHGLARRKNFNCISETPRQLVFRLDSDSDTLSVFPWHFSLEITYTLSENHVFTSYTTSTKRFSMQTLWSLKILILLVSVCGRPTAKGYALIPAALHTWDYGQSQRHHLSVSSPGTVIVMLSMRAAISKTNQH